MKVRELLEASDPFRGMSMAIREAIDLFWMSYQDGKRSWSGSGAGVAVNDVMIPHRTVKALMARGWLSKKGTTYTFHPQWSNWKGQ